MQKASASWRDYLTLGKPRVVALMMLTALIGMLMASPGLPSWQILLWGNVGIALCAMSAAAINHVIDREIDVQMQRTRSRPVADQRIPIAHALAYALFIGTLGAGLLWTRVNALTTILSLASLLGYALIYTVLLKYRTPYNIVIGGLAGASPPLLGWTAVSGTLDPHALLLVLIIFTWTPPHFWALALARKEEYASVAVPMLPVTHGSEYTRQHILLYTLLLLASSMLPYVTGLSGLMYLLCALVLGAVYLYYAAWLLWRGGDFLNMPLFYYSIWYLALLFLAMLLDHYWLYRVG